MVTLRPYQLDVSQRIDAAWSGGASVVCAVLPTGSGKTVLFADKIARNQGVSFAVAHRQELVGQMSMALAAYGLPHNVLAPKNVIKWIVAVHTQKYGRHFFDPNARAVVTGVKTLINRADNIRSLLNRASLWVIDEFHHCLRGNIWGKAAELFPAECKGLGVTATPERADGRGIGRHADGLADALVVGPGMRHLINAGYLSDYRIFGPYTNIDLSAVTVSSTTGDYSKPKLVAAARKSQIVGDVVKSYLDIAPGCIGVTFATDVQTAQEMADNYNASGVPARVVHAKTPDRERQESTEMLARGDLKQLVNVDIFGEGYDLPAIETISMARPTQSYPLYSQQFGRSLRTLPGKQYAIIIDHVRNVERHGLPDRHREWSLDSREKRSRKVADPDLIPVRTCLVCTQVYESWAKVCPFCGTEHKPEANATVEQVEGDITELDPSVLAAMRGEIERIDAPDYTVGDRLRRAGMPKPAVNGAMKRHRERQDAQVTLRDAIAEWAGYQRAAGSYNGDSMRRFYAMFGYDILSAQALGRREAEELTENIRGYLR